jgi:hypothetical protein
MTLFEEFSEEMMLRKEETILVDAVGEVWTWVVSKRALMSRANLSKFSGFFLRQSQHRGWTLLHLLRYSDRPGSRNQQPVPWVGRLVGDEQGPPLKRKTQRTQPYLHQTG